MQQRNALGRQLLQRTQHGIKFHPQFFTVEIGVSIYFETGATKDGHVVFPSRIADPNLRIREIAFQEVGPHFQRTRAAHGLNGGDAALLQHGVFGTEQQLLNCAAVRL
ncbi:hypothetical protein D3C75_1010020 [compost metagenome]